MSDATTVAGAATGGSDAYRTHPSRIATPLAFTAAAKRMRGSATRGLTQPAAPAVTFCSPAARFDEDKRQMPLA